MAGIAPFSPRALRRLYGSGLADLLPVQEAALAGGWKGDTIFLRHYARSLRVGRQPLPGIHLNTLTEPPDREDELLDLKGDLERAR